MNTPQALLTHAVIGCGRPISTEGATGYGMAYAHAIAFASTGRCRLAAACDIVRANAEAFVARHQPDAPIFTDAREMLAAIRPDIVSICLWPHLHATMVELCAPFRPRAILCEKPMDVHWDRALSMAQACREHGVQLSIAHQRRFTMPLQRARTLIEEGAIGRLLRMDSAWIDMADCGTHVLDMMFFLNKETPVEWVLGQIEPRGSRRLFGAIMLGQAFCEFRFANGVRATYHGGHQHQERGAMLRVRGETGELEILFEQPWLRIRRDTQPGWESIDTGETIHDEKAFPRVAADIVDCLDTGRSPLLSAEHALRATEIIFATYASAQRRARVDLPLPPGPSALQAMIDGGQLTFDV